MMKTYNPVTNFVFPMRSDLISVELIIKGKLESDACDMVHKGDFQSGQPHRKTVPV